MASTLVRTKFFVPQPRSALVARPRLLERLAGNADTALTLVSAPPGFGKTTVLSTWLASRDDPGRTVAWVSLDESDASAGLFWQYVVTALATVVPGLGASVLPLLASGQPTTPELLTSVLNDVAEAPERIELVLDDYHLADGPDVAEGMTFLLDHRPPNLRVVIGTRADPALPLSRLRARGQLVEVRAVDLRFTVEETWAYLTELHALTVERADVVALESRTEGWAAALQLAALSLRDRADVGEFVAGFAGTDRFVVDYLVDEVLSRQNADVRDFLTRSSILGLLSGDLCDAVLGSTGGEAMLESLERANLFVVPLDDERRWYRYHHLFADVLQAHLRSEHPDEVARLHVRASRWFAEAGEPVPAVRHALAAGEVDTAADLVERATPALRRDRDEATIRQWVEAFPDDVVRRRPVLALGFIGALMSSNEFAAVGHRLDALEAQLPAIRARLAHDSSGDATAAPGLTVVDEHELARAAGAIELYRAGLALLAGDLAGTHRHAALAIESAAADDDVVRAGASGLSGLASWASGELEQAFELYTACIAGLLRAQHVSDALGCHLTLAEIRLAQGRVGDAQRVYDEALGLARGDGTTPARGIADVHVGMAEVALVRGDREAARANLDVARRYGEPLGLPRYAYRSRAVAALLAEADGDVREALELVTAAQQVYLGDFSPNVAPLSASEARLQLRLGDLPAAEAWVRDRRLSTSEELGYLREFEHVTLAEVLLARHRARGDDEPLGAAEGLLRRLLTASTAHGRGATTLEVTVLLALAAEARAARSDALDLLDQAVRAAEPEGEVRAFSRHGPVLVPVLAELATASGPGSYAALVLAACTAADAASTLQVALPATTAPIEPLSPRELEVLALLASDLDGPEIARHLFLSLNTVRTHTKNIYTKLGVTNRRSAVRRGRDMGLITG